LRCPLFNKQDLGNISLERKFFERLDEIDKEADAKYNEDEHLFFEDNGMGLDVSKIFGNPYFEQDIIYPSPKFSFCLQLLEEDIDKKLHIFQNGIGYFYYDQNENFYLEVKQAFSLFKTLKN